MEFVVVEYTGGQGTFGAVVEGDVDGSHVGSKSRCAA